MKQYKQTPITKNELLLWKSTNRNPRTKRPIKQTSKLGLYFKKEYEKVFLPKDSYIQYRNKKVDPLLMINLPVINRKPLFKFEYKWNPYSGKRLEKDPRGKLYFDPDCLIHYFYSNRLNHLWIPQTEEYTGHYGDAIGNGPDFNVPGRGKHPDWYLFRLPLLDGYIETNNCGQAVTLGPKLLFKEIEQIHKFALTYKNNFYKTYGYPRPNLIYLYVIYHQAISKHPNLSISKDLDENLDSETRKELELIENQQSINLLKSI